MHKQQNSGKNSRSNKRGFAAMSPSERSRIARMGGRASHAGERGLPTYRVERQDGNRLMNCGGRGAIEDSRWNDEDAEIFHSRGRDEETECEDLAQDEDDDDEERSYH